MGILSRFAVTVIAGCVHCATVIAESRGLYSGEVLRNECRAVLRGREEGAMKQADMVLAQDCLGYIRGFVDGHAVVRDARSAAQRGTTEATRDTGSAVGYCLPENVSVEQPVEVYVKFADEHPELLHFPAALLLHDALAEGFPCR